MDSFTLGAGHQRDQAVIRSLGLSAPPLILQEIELVIDHAYVIKPPEKIPKVWGSGSS